MRATASVGRDKGARLVQGTNHGGGAYGEDPYACAGHAHAGGYDYGSTADDTATLSWPSAQLAQWTYPPEHHPAPAADWQVTGMPPHETGRDHLAATAWDASHGDVLTVLSPDFDPPGDPAWETGTPKTESVRPVFVDSSGRRQRRVLRAAKLLVLPAGGYLALLVSTLLGGPSISSPFVPQPDPTHPTPPRATAPDSPSGTRPSARGASPTAARKDSGPAEQETGGSTNRTASSATPAATSEPTAASSTTSSPAPARTAVATPTSASKGRALGSSHRPVK